MSKRRIYLDYAAATPLCEESRRAMDNSLKAGFSGNFGNPASIHKEGLLARDLIEASRRKIAKIIEVHPDEIIFTSGGTEGNNLVIFGIIRAALYGGAKLPNVITSSIEHSSVLETVNDFKDKGVKVNLINPDEKSPVSLSQIEKTLDENTILISIALVNSEIGSIAPLRDISRLIAKFKNKIGRDKNDYPYLHTDASQAAGLLSIAPHNLGVDFLTADAGKFYGPKGSGFIFAGREKKISPIMFGGGQEKGLRPGTPNTPAICAMAAAFKSSVSRREKEWVRLSIIKKEFMKGLLKIFPKCSFNGEAYKQLPSFVNICIPGLDAEFTSVRLDRNGLAVSAASACRSISGGGSSYVISAIPGKTLCAKSSLRFSFGRYTKMSDIKQALGILQKIVQEK